MFTVEQLRNMAKAITICEEHDECNGCPYDGICRTRGFALQNDIVAALSELATIRQCGDDCHTGMVVYDVIVGNDGERYGMAPQGLYADADAAERVADSYHREGYDAEVCARAVR